MKKTLLIISLLTSGVSFAQNVGINGTGALPDASSMLDVSSTTKGLLTPRMTLVQRNAIASPATGLLIYQTDNTPGFYYYNGTTWVQAIGPAGPTGATGAAGTNGTLSPGTAAGNTTYWNGTSWVLNSANIYNNGANVGIGTTAPSQKLHVDGNLMMTNSTNGVMLNAADRPLITRGWDAFTSGTYNGLGRWGLFMEASTLVMGTPNLANNGNLAFRRFNADGTSTTTMFMNAAGNMGIGSTAPGAKLQIDHNAASTWGTAILLNESAAGNSDGAKIGFDKYTPDKRWSIGLLNGATETGFGIFEDGGINGYGTTRMYWQAGGNIGVGTTTPTYKMHVLGDIYANGGWMRVSGNNGLYFESWGGGFYMSDATWVRINNNKNLYTAATIQADASMNSSVFNFGYWDIADPAQVDGQLFRTGGQAVIEVDDWLYVRDNDNNNRIQFNTDQGAVYTGSGNSIYMLSQSGKFQQAANFNFAANGVLLENNISESGGIQANGDNVNIWSPGDADLLRFYDEDGMILRSYINASGNYFSTSDIRKKENILKIDNGLDKVLQLNGYLYNYKLHADEIKKGDVPRQTAGVMIQEVQKVMPELVDDKGEEGLYLNYDGMVPYLIEAIKAQQEQIDALNKKIEELQKN